MKNAMCSEENIQNFRQALQKQLTSVEMLRELPFDDTRYEDWRVETGLILDKGFGHFQSEQHPCTAAFLAYRIPKHYTATREGMQEFYRNILRYQADLLKLYVEDSLYWEGLN